MATIEKRTVPEKTPNPCSGSTRIAVVHDWTPVRAPVYLHYRDGRIVKVAEGTTCGWSGWNEPRKRYAECWMIFTATRPTIGHVVKGLKKETWEKEMRKGPSYVKEWGFNLRETASGSWQNFNECHVNNSPMMYQKERTQEARPDRAKDAFQPGLYE